MCRPQVAELCVAGETCQNETSRVHDQKLGFDLVVFVRHAVGTTATSVNFGSPLVDVLRGLAQVVRLPGDLERRLECRAARLLGWKVRGSRTVASLRCLEVTSHLD